MKKLIFLLLILFSFLNIAYSADLKKPSGIQEGSDFGFGNITGNRIDAVTGVFDNITAKLIISPTTELNFENSTHDFYFKGAYIEGPGASGRAAIRVGAAGSLTVPQYAVRGDFTSGLGLDFATKEVSLTSNSETIFIAHTSISTLFPNAKGLFFVNGGISTGFRNLSSASETITTADHTIFCLANDNVVTLNLPQINSAYSQTLMVKYIDSGSTNKCKLDGNASEQVEGFDVYSGLDTYKEGIILKSDGSNWWITGGL